MKQKTKLTARQHELLSYLYITKTAPRAAIVRAGCKVSSANALMRRSLVTSVRGRGTTELLTITERGVRRIEREVVE